MGKFNKERISRERNSDRFEEKPRNRSSSRGVGRFERKESRGFSRGPREFNDRSSGRPRFDKEMHEVICDKCGKTCEVPFRPTAGKPVYCNDCFRKNDGGNDSRDSRRSSNSESSSNGNDLREINKKLDKIMKALEID